jgi:hypothetical protein
LIFHNNSLAQKAVVTSDSHGKDESLVIAGMAEHTYTTTGVYGHAGTCPFKKNEALLLLKRNASSVQII